MAIIVNKEEKRRTIAQSCSELLLENGIDNLTIAQIAQSAGIGKGTVYEYFENKEDIVFEIITLLMMEFERRALEQIRSVASTKEKLQLFLGLMFEDEFDRRHLGLYQEYLAISLVQGTPQMMEFSLRCREKFSHILGDILEQGVVKGEICEASRGLISSLILFGRGVVVDSKVTGVEAKTEIAQFLDTLFELIKIEEEK